MFLIAPLFLRRRIRADALMVGFALISVLVFLSTMVWRNFPTAYVEGMGLTQFKIISEYIIIAIYASSIYLLWRSRASFDRSVLVLITGSIAAGIAADLAFTTYVNVYAFSNLLGHYFKIISFYLLYKTIIQTGFEQPFDLLFRDLKQNEDELRISENRVRRLVDSNIIGVLYSREDGTVTEANQAFLSIIGYTQDDLHSGRIHWTDLTPYEFLALDEKALSQAKRDGACVPYEKEYFHKDGHHVPIMIGFAALDPGLDEYICFVLDLSALKQAQHDLTDYAVRLERSNRELQNFAFVASHDLQEPLRKIESFGDRLRGINDGHFGEKEKDYLDRMLSATTRMRNMIDSLLSLSRITTQAKPFCQVDLNVIANDVLSDLDVRITTSAGKVDIEPLPVIEADPMQMQQLLQNLIGNALKFHPKGVPPYVRIFARPSQQVDHGSFIDLVVEDQGIGFDDSQLENMIQPFTRLHGRSEYEGSGIGLAICARIVERHRGSITARSTPDRGSTFIIQLPIHQSNTISSS